MAATLLTWSAYSTTSFNIRPSFPARVISFEEHVLHTGLVISFQERVLHAGLISSEWLQRSAAQLTYYGLVQLYDTLGEGTHCTHNRGVISFSRHVHEPFMVASHL